MICFCRPESTSSRSSKNHLTTCKPSQHHTFFIYIYWFNMCNPRPQPQIGLYWIDRSVLCHCYYGFFYYTVYVIHVHWCRLLLQHADGNFPMPLLVPSDLFMADSCFHCLWGSVFECPWLLLSRAVSPLSQIPNVSQRERSVLSSVHSFKASFAASAQLSSFLSFRLLLLGITLLRHEASWRWEFNKNSTDM